jgi:hypothetical protein
MPISDFKPGKETVPFLGGSFDVRGLTVADLTSLAKIHMPEMELLTRAVAGRAGELTPDTARALGLELLQESPLLAANVIAHAADELDELQTVMKMPVYVQLAALEAIGRLTFRDVAGVKNTFEAIQNLAIRLSPPAELAAPLNGGSRSKRGTGRSAAA